MPGMKYVTNVMPPRDLMRSPPFSVEKITRNMSGKRKVNIAAPARQRPSGELMHHDGGARGRDDDMPVAGDDAFSLEVRQLAARDGRRKAKPDLGGGVVATTDAFRGPAGDDAAVHDHRDAVGE